MQLLLPDLVNKPSLAQPAKTAAGPAGSKKLPPEPAVDPVNAADTAESYAELAVDSVKKIHFLPKPK